MSISEYAWLSGYFPRQSRRNDEASLDTSLNRALILAFWVVIGLPSALFSVVPDVQAQRGIKVMAPKASVAKTRPITSNSNSRLTSKFARSATKPYSKQRINRVSSSLTSSNNRANVASSRNSNHLTNLGKKVRRVSSFINIKNKAPRVSKSLNSKNRIAAPHKSLVPQYRIRSNATKPNPSRRDGAWTSNSKIPSSNQPRLIHTPHQPGRSLPLVKSTTRATHDPQVRHHKLKAAFSRASSPEN